jgi:CRISPR/Cas system-associated exonuclease Cas4 (RecB family)
MTTEVQEVIHDQLSPDKLLADYRQLKKGRERSSIATANWVTTLGHKCEAYAVYNRTVHPKDRRPLKESLGMIFAEGNDQARAIKRDLFEMGYEVEGAESQVSWPKYQITGRQDLTIRKSGVRHSVHAEIKSCSPFTYDGINSVDDLKTHKWSFIHKWYAQVALYMVLQSVDHYWMILKNKSTGALKILEFTLGNDELQRAEAMLQKAEKVNRLVQIGQMPTADMKISTADLCAECEFFTVCLPELNFGMAAHILTDESAAELAQKTERLTELKPLAKEYEDLDEEVKGEIKALCADGNDQVVYGDWCASIKRIDIKAATINRKAYVQERVSFIKALPPQVAELETP